MSSTKRVLKRPSITAPFMACFKFIYPSEGTLVSSWYCPSSEDLYKYQCNSNSKTLSFSIL